VAEAAMVGEIAALLAASALFFRFGGPKVVDALRRQVRGFGALLPRSRQERTVFALLAVTAGICEEFVVRGFGIAYLHWLWPGAPRLAVIVITAAVFGLGHLYQGLRGVVVTGLVGAFFAWLVLSTGSLVPAMVLHALLDLRILALPNLADGPAAPADPPITPAATEAQLAAGASPGADAPFAAGASPANGASPATG
jgi:membrane protease YdiL (CAAX protease family)